MYDYVFFDVDGTLINSTQAILEGFQTGHRELDLDYPGNDVIQNEFGKSLLEILHILKVPEDKHTEFAALFRQSEMNSNDFVVYDGMIDVLDLIKEKGLPLILVTSKSREPAKHVLEIAGLGDRVDVLVTASDVDRTKPDPEPLLVARTRAGILEQKDILYVGDTIFDMEAALRANYTPVGVLWGTHREKLLEKYPDQQIVETPRHLLEFLQTSLRKAP